MVGPFIFFDQIGPVQLIAGRGIDVRPHPISLLPCTADDRHKKSPSYEQR
jgi:hypothetical protein